MKEIIPEFEQLNSIHTTSTTLLFNGIISISTTTFNILPIDINRSTEFTRFTVEI